MTEPQKVQQSIDVSYREVFNSVEAVNIDHWNSVTRGANIYLSIDYLRSLESTMRDSIDFCYAISYNENDIPVLISVFQLVVFEDKRRKYASHLGKIACHVKNKVLSPFTINLMVCGNVFSDGENGFMWKGISQEVAIEEVALIAEELKLRDEVKEKSSITLFKEFRPESVDATDELLKRSYRGFMADVNMILKIHKDWVSLEDYTASMKTKFRTRFKSVLKKSKALEIKTLSEEQIEQNADRINELFCNVLEKSDFGFGRLSAAAFKEFQKSLQEKFCMRGFFYNEQLVGFSTSFKNNDILEANYVGLDYSFNKKLSVYQRILYDYVEQSLNYKSKELHLGRTAEMIKSSIGAIPMNMKLYARHRKSVPNLLLKPIIQSISPSDFELRKPFKSDFNY
tara:strand:+ start:7275 stop:8468 length:1194 start_codon:yes stop_codon:yes gene_type:complete